MRASTEPGALHTELERSARPPKPPHWADRNHRPLGHVIAIERAHADYQQQHRTARAALERNSHWLHANWQTLLDLDARIASATATGHGRSTDNNRELCLLREQLADEYQSRSGEHTDLVQAHRQIAQLLEATEMERRVRAALEPDQHRAENGAREAAASTLTSRSAQTSISLRR